MKVCKHVCTPVHAEFEPLSLMAKVRGALQVRLDPLTAKRRARFGFKIFENPADLRGAGRKHHGARELSAQIGVENAKRGKRTGRRRHQHLADSQRCSERARMQWSR